MRALRPTESQIGPHITCIALSACCAPAGVNEHVAGKLSESTVLDCARARVERSQSSIVDTRVEVFVPWHRVLRCLSS